MKNKVLLKVVIIFLFIILFSFCDFIVLEKIYKPLSAEYSIPWNAFEIIVGGVNLMWWAVAFFVLIFATFILLGIAMLDWKVSVAGILLFMAGWEDIFYYIIQGQWLPATLDWLDASPLMTLSRFVTGTEHVSGLGVLITGIIGLAIVVVLFRKDIFEKKTKKR